MSFAVLIEKLISEKAQTFIANHLKEDTNKLRLKYHNKNDFPYSECIDQIEAKQRLFKKNPSWANNSALIFPPKLNVEQSSSEATSNYKAGIVHGDRFIDLTGGMGVDSIALSKRFKEGVYCELSNSLCKISEHNFEVLNANIKTVNKNSFNVLKEATQQFDLAYADPARRIKGKHVVSLKDCEPDITKALDLIFEKANQLLIKTSPLLDISKVLTEILFVKEVHVVSVNNECKELLFLSEKGNQNKPQIVAVNIIAEKVDVLSSSSYTPEISYGLPKNYLLEPNASIMKSALFSELADSFNLLKLQKNSHLFTTDILPSNFPGKVFEIEEILQPFKKSLKGESFNIVTRNFGMKPEQIKKKLKTKDGGARFLYATTLKDNKKAFIMCKKVD
jgi:hypothetical protein